MATTVYDTQDILLQNGQEVTIKPLDLKRLRRVMAMWERVITPTPEKEKGKTTKKEEPVEGITSDTSILDFLAKASKVCLEKDLPELVADEDKFEEALDLPTMWRLMEVCAGISLDPNRQGAAATENLPGLT